jgi:hypothetical protein
MTNDQGPNEIPRTKLQVSGFCRVPSDDWGYAHAASARKSGSPDRVLGPQSKACGTPSPTDRSGFRRINSMADRGIYVDAVDWGDATGEGEISSVSVG